ncbi:MAG: hypothetical protein ABUK01_10255 [Leptospirales bacterium]
MGLCQGPDGSCSSCCGLYNLDFSVKEREKWLTTSTNNFLQLDLTDSLSVYKYRLSVEPSLRLKSILNDVYVCPFIGWVNGEKTRSGCLLHPEGSPHPTTDKLDHPQSYSFYGQSICQNYNCSSKSKVLPFTWKSLWQKNIDPFLYGRVVSNHNLLNVISEITQNKKYSVQNLLSIVLKYAEKYPVPVTSFEMTLSFGFYTPDQLWDVLGTLFDKQSYGKNAFVLTKEGKKIGSSIRSEMARI